MLTPASSEAAGLPHSVPVWYRTSVPVYQPICMGKQFKIAAYWYVPGQEIPGTISLLSPQYVNFLYPLDIRYYALSMLYTNAKKLLHREI